MTALESVLAAAVARGHSVIPPSLLPAGFHAWADEGMVALAGYGRGGWNEADRKVRTPGGSLLYHAPIGTTITAKMRSDAKKLHGGDREARQFINEGRGAGKAGKEAAGVAGDAAGAAEAAKPAHPEDVAGHKVRSIYTHPQTKRAIYDLGDGLHSEGEPGAKAGPVMRSNTGIDEKAFGAKGWKRSTPPRKPAIPAGSTNGKGQPGKPPEGAAPDSKGKPPVQGAPERRGGAPKKAAASRRLSPLAERQKTLAQQVGAKSYDPYDWNMDWVPPEDKGLILKGELLKPAAGVKQLSSKGRATGDGTAADPIDVKGNISQALKLMAQGKHVRLNQPTELTLLMQKVVQLSKESEATKSGPKPDWDFGLLTVRGTNLFTAQTKGIPRINMPQFSGVAEPGSPAAKMAGGDGKFIDLSDKFGEALKADGIKVTTKKVPAAELRATQTELVGSKVAGFAAAFLRGDPKAVKAMQEPIYVTRDGYVVDGHHRWAANMLVDAVDGRLGNDTPMNVRMIDMDIGAMIPYANDFAARMGIAGRGGVSKATQKPATALDKVKAAAAAKAA